MHKLIAHDVLSAVVSLLNSRSQVSVLQQACMSAQLKVLILLSCDCILNNIDHAFAQSSSSATSATQEAQLCGLSVLSALATSSDAVNAQVLSQTMLERLHAIVCNGACLNCDL